MSYNERWDEEYDEDGNFIGEDELEDDDLFEDFEVFSKKEVKALHKRALEGDADSQNDLAYCYEHGLHVNASAEKAIFWYTRASEKNHDLATFNLAVLFFDCKQHFHDLDIAYELICKAIDLGSADAKFVLAEEFFNRTIEPSDKSNVISLLSDERLKAHAPSLFLKAQCYETGYGVEVSAVKASTYYQQASNLGSDSAKKRLVKSYVNGEITVTNPAYAVEIQ